jgi:hypothetical protein
VLPKNITLVSSPAAQRLSAKRYVYFWVDRIYGTVHLEAQCLLANHLARPEGKKELVGLIDDARESAQSRKGAAPRSPATRDGHGMGSFSIYVVEH